MYLKMYCFISCSKVSKPKRESLNLDHGTIIQIISITVHAWTMNANDL